MIALRRDVLDSEMTAPLRAASALQLGFGAETINPKPAGVAVTVQTPEGERQIWQARCVVLATATGSPLLESVGILPRSDTVHSTATIQVDMNCVELPQDKATIYLGQQAAPGGWCLVMPRGDGRATLKVTARTGNLPIQPYLERLILRPELKRALITGLLEHSAVGYNGTGALTASVGRGPVLAAGSAAGQCGLALGLAAGRLAAEAVIRAVRLGKPDTAARRSSRLFFLA